MTNLLVILPAGANLPRATEGSELKKASASEILKMYSSNLI